MDYASKFPEAIPLKKVTAESVAEAMVEVFSRTGIPEEVLTDQGSVFMGRLTKQLCSLLEISHLRTSPYAPPERWHAETLAWQLERNAKEATER